MRICLALCCGLALAGCTRDNPAFETSSESEVTGAETAPSTESGPPPPEEGTEEGASCDLVGGGGYEIKLVPFCSPDEEGFYDRWFNVIGATNSTWTVESCFAANCADCEGQVDSPLTIAPLEVGDLAGEGDCIHVRARRLPTDNVDSCVYHSIVVELDDPNSGPVPIVVARTAGNLAMPPVPGAPELDAFSPAMDVDEECACEDYPAECCGGSGSGPTVWMYPDIDGAEVFLDEQADLLRDGRDYEFWALDGFDSGVCDAPRDVAWAVYAL